MIELCMSCSIEDGLGRRFGCDEMVDEGARTALGWKRNDRYQCESLVDDSETDDDGVLRYQ